MQSIEVVHEVEEAQIVSVQEKDKHEKKEVNNNEEATLISIDGATTPPGTVELD